MIRVFPRKTSVTPDDDSVYFTGPPLWELDDREVMVSCSFTYDRPLAESLAKQWESQGYDVSVGGPAYGDAGGEFVPGRFVRQGYTMTSRGCNNKCWFCYVWKREGVIRELPIVDGWNVLDSNLLQCSEAHIRNVFAMLKRQPERPVFTGGLEARILKDWHIDLLRNVKPKRVYFAYDDDDDYEPLVSAANRLLDAGFTKASHSLMCYCLIGYPKDEFSKAETRLQRTKDLGFTPMAMLYRDDKGEVDAEWRRFQRLWARPAIIHS